MKFPFEINHDIFVAAVRVGEVCHLVTSEEEQIISSWSSSKRKAEFLAGREAAHKALRALNKAIDAPILRGKRGDPLFPDGITGSISHTNDVAIAAVSKKENVLSVGIDIERKNRSIEFNPTRITTKEEIYWNLSEEKPEFLKIFVAKEAAYKAIHSLIKKPFGFLDLILKHQIKEKKECFCISDKSAIKIEHCNIQIIEKDDFILALCVITP